MIAPNPEWEDCELEEHLLEVRARHGALSRMLAARPFDTEVLEAVWTAQAAVGELLEHLDGLHAPDVLVRAIEG